MREACAKNNSSRRLTLRILFLSNYYPPSDSGWGYMQLCEEVADGLAARGHEIAVLTSTHRDGPEIARPYPVHRLLTVEPDWHGRHSVALQFFVGRRRRESAAVSHLNFLIESFRPQSIFVWHAIGLPRVLLRAAEQLAPTVYYLANYFPELPDEYIAYWQASPVGGAARLIKRPLAKVALAMLYREGKPVLLQYKHVICVSHYVRQRLVNLGLIPADSVAIHNGVDVLVFSPVRPARQLCKAATVSCLVAGRIVPEKGIHTVIDAFAQLRDLANAFRLTILGDGPPAYMTELQARVQAIGLEDLVRFQPPIPRQEMPRILDQHDVLLLPSEYAEPIARSMQEGMAMGLLVIGTTLGGSGELLVHEETGLTFDACDPASLARQLRRTVEEPVLTARLAAAGQARVHAAFRIDQTISGIEEYLRNVVR